MDTGLFGPFVLSTNQVDVSVTGKGPGAYALGATNANGGLNVSYVGRSDSDLNARLKQHVGSYTHFKYGFYSTAIAAYEKECRLYHDFGTSGANEVHPARPAGSSAKCPVCGA